MDLFLNRNLKPPYENRVLAILEDTAGFKNSHFEINQLWKHNHPILPNNRDMAVKRFQDLENRFCENSKYFQMYKKQIDDYIKLWGAKTTI